MEVGLVSCTKSKRETAAPPRDLYAPSAYFRKARAYCEAEHDAWYILSAKHHLLHPDDSAIGPYDETLTTAGVDQRREWSRTVHTQLEAEGLLSEDTVLVVHAGEAYVDTLLPLLPEHVTIRRPTEGLAFGETLAWYHDNLPASATD